MGYAYGPIRLEGDTDRNLCPIFYHHNNRKIMRPSNPFDVDHQDGKLVCLQYQRYNLIKFE